MSGQALAPTRAEFKTLKECRNLGEAFACGELMERIKASAPSHVKPQRLLRTFVQATSKTPLLLQCNMRSVLGAMLTCSEVGLEPNTPLQHAFLIPFGKYKWDRVKRERELIGYEVQLIFGYPGLLDLSYRSGQLTSVHADVAYKDEYDNGRFKFEYGTNAVLSHRPERSRPDTETPMFGYAHASMVQGQAFTVMPWEDIIKIRNGSQGFRSALAAKEHAEKNNYNKLPATWTEAPWVKHERKMAGKTVFRALSNWLPKSVELAGVLALDDTQDRSTVDFSAVLDNDASIIDGGYQENGPLVEDDSDPTAAFGLRGGSNENTTTIIEPEKPKTEPKADAKKKATTTKAPEVTKPPSEPVANSAPVESENPAAGVTIGRPAAFSAWLVNGDGEPIDSEDGPAERFQDPVAYALALQNALAAAFPADRELIALANADDAAEASRISPEAAAIITPEPPPTVTEEVPFQPPAADPDPPADGTPPDAWQLAPPGAREWDAWNERFKALLATAGTPEKLNMLIELNYPTYNDFPPKHRVAAKALVEARQHALTQGTPAAPATAVPTAPTFGQLYDELIAAVNACKTPKDMETLEKTTVIVRKLAILKAGAPDLCDKVQLHARTRAAELKKGPLI
jgi:recombination protein RecT